MTRALAVVVLLSAVGHAAPQSGAASAGRQAAADSAAAIETPHLTVKASPEPAAAAPGQRVSLRVDISPKPKMHVYSPQQKDYIPVAVILEASDAYRALPPVFPRPEKYFFAPLKETQLVYSKPFRIVQDVMLGSSAAARGAGQQDGATLTVTGTLRYQACDDAICYLPKTVPLSWTIGVKPPALQ